MNITDLVLISYEYSFDNYIANKKQILVIHNQDTILELNKLPF